MTKPEILARVTDVLVTYFEIEPDRVRLDTDLFEELDLDSIDAIDLVVSLQEDTGLEVSEEELRNVRLVQDVVDLVYRKLRAD